MHAGVETCDDGNGSNNDACLTTCQTASCGDGFVYTGVEVCDGNAINHGFCTAQCTIACDADYDDCNNSSGDGCETSLDTDANCGSCGNSCNGDATCTDGACVATYGPTHIFQGLSNNHYVTQGTCSVGNESAYASLIE